MQNGRPADSLDAEVRAATTVEPEYARNVSDAATIATTKGLFKPDYLEGTAHAS
jgi:hypothetical protein